MLLPLPPLLLPSRCLPQGDPGSTRFFLSLEDPLFRVFGGDKIKGLMVAFQVGAPGGVEEVQQQGGRRARGRDMPGAEACTGCVVPASLPACCCSTRPWLMGASCTPSPPYPATVLRLPHPFLR